MRTRTTEETDQAILGSIQRTARAMERNGTMDKATLQRFEVASIMATPDLDPSAIRTLRERAGASQAVMALHLGVAVGTLSQWERGLRKPDGPALRLLSLIDRHGLDYVR